MEMTEYMGNHTGDGELVYGNKALHQQQIITIIAAFTEMLNGRCDKVIGYVSGGKVCVEQLGKTNKHTV